MIPVLFIVLAAFFKAVADTLQHHYSTSVFKNMKAEWWDPAVSWRHVKTIFGYRPDAWHLANSAMIICFVAASVSKGYPFLWWLMFAGYGVIFCIVFNIFYDKVLR